MAKASTIGLDIGTNAVRAAEVSFGRGRPTLRRFGQVALPHGAVVGGEVADPATVAAALRRLWREAGFKDRSVVVGVSNQRVVARITDLPDMPEDELRSALEFQVQDLIPIPVEEAVLDYQIVERLVGADQTEGLRVLLVAAHRDMVRSLLAALDGAGLSASRIDLVPFALIRSLHVEGADLDPGLDEADVGAAEAIVSVGAGVTNVVVHEQGLPRFVRTLPSGGTTVAEAVASELAVDIDQAEDLTRRSDSGSDDPALARAGEVVSASISPLLQEVRGSLDFFLAQSDGGHLRRVVLTGGGSRLPELDDRLEALLGTEVEPAEPLDAVVVGDTGFAPEVLTHNSDLLSVAIGLALSGEPTQGSVRRITLVPGEIAVARRARRQLAGAGAALVLLVVILLALLLLRHPQRGTADEEAEAEEARTAELTQQVGALSEVEALEADIAGRRTTATAVLEGDVAWTRVLNEVATAMPDDVWLTTFSGTRDPSGLAPTTVSFAAVGLEQPSVADWLTRLGEVESITGVWVPNAEKTDEGGQEVVTFTSEAELTPEATSDRAERFAEDVEETP